jgi:hypothetical protein
MSRRAKRIERTLQDYMCLGAYYTILKYIIAYTDVETSYLCGGKVSKNTSKASELIYEACSDAEDCMFKDYPMLENDYVNVFYGGISGSKKTPVAKREKQMIKDILKEMIERLDKE